MTPNRNRRRSAVANSRARRRRGLQLETLEQRQMLAADSVHFTFDYTKDTSGFFADQSRRDLLEQAGRMLTDRLGDKLDPVAASNVNFGWFVRLPDPSTGAEFQTSSTLAIKRDEILVYAGARNLQDLDPASGLEKTRANATVNLGAGFTCGLAGPTCDAFGDFLGSRGESNVLGLNPSDFAPLVASITFDTRIDTSDETQPNWNFEDESLGPNGVRFLSFAVHELAHALGFGVAGSFISKYSAVPSANGANGQFSGRDANTVYTGAGVVPLNGGHLAASVTQTNPSIMTAVISNDLFSPLDFAVLKDIGWELLPDPTPTAELDTSSLVVAESHGTVTVTASLSAPSSSTLTLPVMVTGRAITGNDAVLSDSQFVFAPNETTATISIDIDDDAVNETTDTLSLSLLSGIGVKAGLARDFRLTILDNDGVDLKRVAGTDLASIGETVTVAGDAIPSAIVFRVATNRTLSVQAQNVNQINEPVFLLDRDQKMIGEYNAKGLQTANLEADQPYAIVFFPRLTQRTFRLNMDGGFNNVALESRTNVLFPADVDDNGSVSERDALQIINQINTLGDGSSVEIAIGAGFYDVSGDGRISALDALRVINFLNSQTGSSEPITSQTISPANQPSIASLNNRVDSQSTLLSDEDWLETKIATFVTTPPREFVSQDMLHDSPKKTALAAAELDSEAVDRLLTLEL